MLTNVPTQINRSARLVTLRHPNGMDCTVWRKQVNRTSEADPATAPDGSATIGGLGVLDSEDEADYEFTELGDARIVFTGQFATAGNNWMDDDQGINYQEQPVVALIECVVGPDDKGYFLPDKHDMVTVEPGAGLALGYEIVGISSNLNIPPYVRQYALIPRQDSTVGI